MKTSAPPNKANAGLRQLPSTDDLLRSETAIGLLDDVGRQRLTELIRRVLGEMRDEMRDSSDVRNRAKDTLLDEAQTRLAAKWKESTSTGTTRVINATGVIVHTNLGRAPLSDRAKELLLEAAGYCNVEYDLKTGTRGKRGERAEAMLCDLTGAEDALVVNNCAAAAFFVLTTFASGGEVIISRGEMVEIGGDFRVPDVLSRSGGILREVGTTNRTKLSDYEKAISEKTAMILRVHPSNYRIVGFTATPLLAELSHLAHERKILIYEDAGSGALAAISELGLQGEPSISDSVAAGADIVTFSGDKLLGGPQAGIIVGRRDLVGRLRKDALYRALRADKLIFAALEGTLEAHLRETAATDVPIVRMLTLSREVIEQRSRVFIDKIHNPKLVIKLIGGNSAVGGGAAPLDQPETTLIRLSHLELAADELEAALRKAERPIITRIAEKHVVLDLRTVSEADENELLVALNKI